jgi:membrane-bound lytic murein transglycosylase C
VGFLTISNSTASMHEEMAKMKAEFDTMKIDHRSEYVEYQQKLEKEYQAYQDELRVFWLDPKLSSKKEWVSYSEDKKSRSDVDFENNVITIETIAVNEKQAKAELANRLAYAIAKNTQEVIDTDPLQIRIKKVSESISKSTIVENPKPILSTVIFTQKPSEKELEQYTKQAVESRHIKVTKSKLGSENIYTIKIALPTDTMLKRSKIYEQDVMKNAEYFDMPAPLIFAIIETESSFNPMATSPAPAFGLMQIVPITAGRDIYKFLYKQDGMPTPTSLYNGKNNIKMGTAYLYIVYYRYLMEIKNPQSRLYCSIAAYNTGVGNIAFAFTKKYNVTNAIEDINTLTPDEVYEHLQNNLRYDEPKLYLRKVKKLMNAYKKAYQL